MAFEAQQLRPLKNKHHLENSLVFNLVVIQPWPGPATWAGQTQVSKAAAALEWTFHIRPDLDYGQLTVSFSFAFDS